MKMNEEEKENWEALNYRIDAEGFDYCFEDYSNWKEIKDEEFHKLRNDYLNSMKKLREYVEKKYEESQEEVEDEE